MQKISFHTGLTLAIDIALLVVCLLHVPSLVDRPRPPFDLTGANGDVLVENTLDASACPHVYVGDTVKTWNGLVLTTDHDVEFLADFSAIGDTIQITHTRDGKMQLSEIRLIAAYDLAYVVIILFVGIVAWGVGVFVLVRRPGELTAAVLHWALVMMGVSVMITWGKTSPDSNWMYVSRTLFFVTYAGVAAAFLHLTSLFPGPSSGRIPSGSAIIYLPVFLLAGGMIVFHTLALKHQSLEHFNRFQTLFDIFHIAVVVYVGAGIARFIGSYFRSTSPEERRKIKWVLWGLTVGPLPFLLLTIIPQYYLPFGYVPEEYTLAFLAVIPIAFGVSFIRYHLMDIEVVISRTTVYTIVLGAVIAVYSIVVGTVAAIVGTYTPGTSVVAAVTVALLFEPARRRVQRFVDKQFFRVRYDFREALRRFADDIKMCVDPHQLAGLMIERTDEIIPVERAGVFLIREPEMRLSIVAHKNFDFLERRTVRFQADRLRTPLLLPVALDSKVEPGVVYESADERVFTRWQMALVFPMKSATGEFVGFFVLGTKKSGERFSIEDVDLLANTATEAGLEFERIALQRKLVEEQAEKQRLVEISRLKSDFVSNVSHELRTPLTSIRMYAEMLGSQARTSAKKRRDYLQTIVGETNRLDRLVGNILDSAKIERGVKQYQQQDTDLRDIVTRVLTTMKYQLNKHGFQPDYKKPRRPLQIYADPDAVAEAMINLVDNAIKFSSGKKFLKVSLKRERDRVYCSVRDKGSGISPEALPHLFERFYRDPAWSARVQGVGLGLPLVKQIMDVHGGGVDVSSTPGKGSTFSLWFPASRRAHET